MHFPAPLSRLLASLLAAAGPLLAGGCYHGERTRTYYDSAALDPRPTTALVIVIQEECTEGQYLAWRAEIVDYLIERGYIADEAELIADPAEAQRVIRAIVGKGGFTLSVFNADRVAGSAPDPEFTDIYFPADPYFIFGFYYFGEIGPRHLPPRPPDYRPHPRPPGKPPPHYPRYDHDRHRPHSPRSDDRDHHRRRPSPPPQPDPRDNPPSEPRPTDPGQPPSDHPRQSPRVSPPTPPQPGYTPRPVPAGRREQPRDHPPTPGPAPAPRSTPSGHFTPPPPAQPPPSSKPAKPEKTERKDEEKQPGRPERER